MQYIQILTCNDALGTCCTDYGLAVLLDIVRKFFNILQLIVPILLIIGITIQLIKLVSNPDEKGSPKKIINRIIAALIVFFIPMIIDVSLSTISQTSTFTLADCWAHAKISSEVSQANKSTYIDPNSNKPKTSFLIDPEAYETGTPPTSPNDTGNGASTYKGAQIVAYAKQFVGKPYVYG